MADEGGGVDGLALRRAPGLHDLWQAQAGAERQAAGERLSDDEQVGLHALVVGREPLAGAAEAGEDLVEDEEDAAGAGHFAEPGEPAFGRQVEAAADLDGLDDDGGDVAGARGGGGEQVVEVGEAALAAAGMGVAERAGAAGGVGQAQVAGADAGGEGEAEAVAVATHREGAVRESVVAVVEAEHAGAAGGDDGGLDGRLDGVGAVAAEDGVLQPAGGAGCEPLGEEDLLAGGEEVAHAVDEAAGLAGDGLDHLGVGMAHGRHAEAGGEVDEPVAVGVEDVGAARLGPEDGVGGARGRAAGAAGRDGGALDRGEPLHPGSDRGAGDSGLEEGELASVHGFRGQRWRCDSAGGRARLDCADVGAHGSVTWRAISSLSEGCSSMRRMGSMRRSGARGATSRWSWRRNSRSLRRGRATRWATRWTTATCRRRQSRSLAARR